jgi:hypothetical protein
MSSISPLDNLRKKDYIVIKPIEIDKKVKYLKSYNPDGINVYIYLDSENVVSIDMENKFVVKKYDKSSYLTSSHYNMIDKMPSHSGMAYECHDELCVLLRENDRQIDKPVFKVHESISDSYMTIDGEIIGYPLIRYSEILADPSGAQERAYQMNNHLKKREYDLMNKEFEKIEEIINTLAMNLRKFSELSKRLITKINNQSHILKTFLQRATHLTESEKDKIKLSIFYRDNMERKIVAIQKTSYNFNSNIIEMIGKIDTNCDILKNVDIILGDDNDPIVDCSAINNFL